MDICRSSSLRREPHESHLLLVLRFLVLLEVELLLSLTLGNRGALSAQVLLLAAEEQLLRVLLGRLRLHVVELLQVLRDLVVRLRDLRPARVAPCLLELRLPLAEAT